MDFKDLTPEQKEKVKACKTTEELLAFAKEEGYELTLEQLEGISGGDWDCWDICSKFVEDPRCSMHGFVC